MSIKAGKTRVRLSTAGVIDAFCARVASGRSIKDVCCDVDMPLDLTIYRKMEADAGFAQRIRSSQADGLKALDRNRLDLSEQAFDNHVKRLGFEMDYRKAVEGMRAAQPAEPDAPISPEEAERHYMAMLNG